MLSFMQIRSLKPCSEAIDVGLIMYTVLRSGPLPYIVHF